MAFETLEHFCQLGNDLTEDAPIHLLMVGRNCEGQQCMAIVKLEYLGKDANEIAISNIEIASNFEQLRD